MGAVADKIDPDRLWSSGTIAPYGTGGPEAATATSTSRPTSTSPPLHEYDEGEVESNHGDDARANSAGKPVIVGEFGIKAAERRLRQLSPTAPRSSERKVKAYTTIEGYAGALAWSWQPGNAGKCRFENLDSDKPVQEIMRTVGGDVAETVGRVVEGIRDGLGTALGTVQGTPAR